MLDQKRVVRFPFRPAHRRDGKNKERRENNGEPVVAQGRPEGSVSGCNAGLTDGQVY